MVRKSKPTPPFGRELAARLDFKNYPDFVFVCIGGDAWNRAKSINSRGGHSCAVVCPADAPPCRYRWPVTNCIAIIDWSTGPNVSQIVDLVCNLIKSEASTVAVFPVFEDHEKPITLFNIDSQQWERVRNGVMIYPGTKPA